MIFDIFPPELMKSEVLKLVKVNVLRPARVTNRVTLSLDQPMLPILGAVIICKAMFVYEATAESNWE